jgi:hypothetical protein
LVTEKAEIIAERNETIVHREDQINESDAIITQRNTIIEFLQEQVHDLILEVDDTHTHIDELQQQPVPPAVREAPEGEEEESEEIEGVSDLDAEHGNLEPNPQPDHSSSGSQSSVGDYGRTNLNYTGSSTRVHSCGLQRASNGIIPWPVV